MGDIADWINDTMQEAHPSWMPVGDPYRLAGYSRSTLLRCAHCGARQLYWRMVDGNWRLFELASAAPHHCALLPEDFKLDP